MSQADLSEMGVEDFNFIGGANLVYRMSEDIGHAQGVMWNVQARVLGEDESEDVVLVEMDIWIVTRDGPSIFWAADDVSADVSRVATGLLKKDNNPRWFTRIENGASDFVVVDKVIVNPEWRGRKLGPVFTGLALMRLCPNAFMVGLYPKALGTDDPEIQQKVERAWSQLGFVRGREGIWYLDLETWAFPEFVAGALKLAY